MHHCLTPLIFFSLLVNPLWWLLCNYPFYKMTAMMKFYEYFLLNKMCCVASGRFGKRFLGWSKKLNRVDLLVLEERNSCYRWQQEISIYRPTSAPPICKSNTWCLLIAMVNLNNYLHSINVRLNVFYALFMHISQLLFYHKFSARGGASGNLCMVNS